MTHDLNDLNRIDMIEIELEARRLRAEAISHGAASFRAWIAGLFSGRGIGHARPQH